MDIINVEQVHKSFGNHHVLKGVTFSIQEPGIVALVGPNGSGKSTLMNIIMNLIDADSGDVKILGESPSNVNIFQNVSFLKDNSVLYHYLTGRDHLDYAASLYGLDQERVHEVIDKIGIDTYVDKRVEQYSLGMKQHLLIALAILNQPKFILMDEPLNGLDPTSVIHTRQLILELAAAGTSILMSSHTLSEVDAVTNHILFLREGIVQEEYLSGEHVQRKKTAEERYMELYLDEL